MQIYLILYKALYVQHNIEARLWNHCYSGKTLSIKYSKSCSLTYPACNAHRPYCDLVPTWLYNILQHHLINGTIFGGEIDHDVFPFSLQLLSETSVILRATEQDRIKNVY